MFKLSITLLLALSISACAPRGEYKSVDTLLKLAKERYAQVMNTETPVKEDLASLTSNLDALLKDQAVAAEIAKSLRKLTTHAGFPSRPAISELALQYETINSADASKLLNEASLKLLASRTFNLLASELQSTAFKVS